MKENAKHVVKNFNDAFEFVNQYNNRARYARNGSAVVAVHTSAGVAFEGDTIIVKEGKIAEVKRKSADHLPVPSPVLVTEPTTGEPKPDDQATEGEPDGTEPDQNSEPDSQEGQENTEPQEGAEPKKAAPKKAAAK